MSEKGILIISTVISHLQGWRSKINNMKKLIPQELKNIYHLVNSALANFWYGFPSRKLKVIGVTGTNGKTTTVQMIAKILEIAGHKVAVSSTINFKLGQKAWVNKTKFTTLSAWKVQEFINKAVDSSCDYLVLEVSSHSLDQNRVRDVEFDVAVITNVTREHLDYHKTMEQYRAAKMKLFRMFKEKEKTAVVNLEMGKPEEFLGVANKAIKFGYGFQEGLGEKLEIAKLKTIYAEGVLLGQRGSSFSVEGVAFALSLVGEFNIENALAAICVGLSQGIDLETMAHAIKEIKKVSGRMDYVENDRGLDIIIDYALTPDSMEKLGQYLNQTKRESQKLIWMLGSCGERDHGKRPTMGKIVSKYADYVIVTNEDPYHEDPQKIIDEVCEGVFRGGKKENIDAWKIFDRKQAIKKALKLARQDDIILITGKGAEETMAIGDKRIPWNDKKVVQELLREM